MSDTPVNSQFREQAARWLQRAMEGAGLRDSEVLKASGVAKSTFYRLKQAEGEPDQETLNAIAKAIGVPAPQIGKVLLYDALEVTGPLGMVREARAILQRAETMLAAGEPSNLGLVAETPVGYTPDPKHAAKLKEIAEILKAVDEKPPAVPAQKSRRASGR